MLLSFCAAVRAAVYVLAFSASPFAAAQAPSARDAESKPDVVSVAEAASFASFLAPLLERPDVEAVMARVDLDRLVAEIAPYVTLTDAQRAAARAEGERNVRAILAAGPFAHVDELHENETALVRFLQFDARGSLDFVDFQLGHAKDGGVRIIDVLSHRRLMFVSTTAIWHALAAGATPVEAFGLDAEHVQSLRAAYRSLDAVRSAPPAERGAAFARLAEDVPGRNLLVSEFVLGGSGPAPAVADAELARIAEEMPQIYGARLWTLDRAIERRDADSAFAAIEDFHDAFAEAKARPARALVELLRARAWLVAPDLELARQSFARAAQCEPALDPAWNGLVDLALARKDNADLLDVLARAKEVRTRPGPDVARDPRFADFLRSQEGARWKALPAADPAQPRAADVLTFAFALESAVRTTDVEALHELVNTHKVVEIATAGIDTDAKFLRGVRSGAATAMSTHAELVKAIEAGATFDLLRVRTRDGKPTALYRLAFPEGGVEYIEFDVGRGSKGELEAQDWFTYSQGARVSEVMREAFLPMAMEQSKGLLDKLFKDQSSFAAHFPKLTEMVTANQKSEFQKTLDLYAQLPADVQKSRFTQRLRFIAAQGAGGAAYESALDDMQKIYGTDPVVDFISLDLHALRKRFDLVEACLKRLEVSLGGDPHCDFVRASSALEQNDYAGAERWMVRCIRRGLDRLQMQWVLLSCRLKAQHYDAVLAQLVRMTDRYGLEWNDVGANEDYAGFVKSDVYSRWLEFLRSRGMLESK